MAIEEEEEEEGLVLFIMLVDLAFPLYQFLL